MKTAMRFNCFRNKVVIFFLLLICGLTTQAQTFSSFSSPSNAPASSGTDWMIGGRLGMSLASGSGNSSAGLQIGPMAEVIFSRNFAVGTELNINTQSGTPIEWADYFKMYFNIPGSSIKPYANLGVSLWFVTDGPYFGIRLGGGALFKVANNVYIPADLQLGPVFFSEKTFDIYGKATTKGNTIFYLAITTGIRYQLP
jgi:hypothetical protein